MEGDLAECVRGAGQAGVVAADDCLDSVQHRFRQLRALDVTLRYLEHAPIHRQIVVTRGDHEVHPLDDPIGINPVVMQQRAAWCLGDSDSVIAVDPGDRANARQEDVWPAKEFVDALGGVEGVDQPCVVIVERATGNEPESPTVKAATLPRVTCAEF